MQALLDKAYDPEVFRQLGHQIIDLLADHLQQMQHKPDASVLAWQEPAAELDFWQKDYATHSPAKDPVELMSLIQQTIDRSIHLHHPHYFGHQIARPLPVASLAGLVADTLNNGMGIYEMGKVGTALEKLIIQLTAKQFGFPESADGFLTSGGTLANLTALLAARRKKAAQDVWTEGHQQQLAIMVSASAHYCIERAVRIMGWGNAGIISIPTDEHFRLRPECLSDHLNQAKAKGIQVLGVVGCACSTSTGSYDDLRAIGAFCREHDLWFHVDAAHGGAVAFSEKYHHLVDGIELADSVVIDYHKMLLTPALATGVLFKEQVDGYASFALEAKYLFEKSQELEWYNLARRTFECTKQMMSLKIYSILRTYGTAIFEASVNQLYDQSKSFAKQIQEIPSLELAVQPDSNILCFRYYQRDCSKQELNHLNARIRQTIMESGKFYLVQTQLNGKLYLRCSIMNPATTDPVFQALLQEVQTTASELLTQLHQ